MDQFEGKPLNAPNDLVVKSDGSIWFTDPGYGILMDYEGHRAEFELNTNVYCLDPQTLQAHVVADDFSRPNGLCFSPDESLLYIVNTGFTDGPEHSSDIRVFDVIDRRLTNGRVFVDMKPGGSDGIRADRAGNIWSGAGWVGDGFDGVHCFDPDGTLIGKIHLPAPCANLCFGGAKKNRLFMTASQSLFSLYVETNGAQTP
jgi:gluconolactonase